VILAGVDRGGGGQHGEGSEFENGELHDCCYGFGAAAFCFMVFYAAAPMLIKSGSDFGYFCFDAACLLYVGKGHGIK
jgi:hypothetical protein